MLLMMGKVVLNKHFHTLKVSSIYVRREFDLQFKMNPFNSMIPTNACNQPTSNGSMCEAGPSTKSSKES